MRFTMLYCTDIETLLSCDYFASVSLSIFKILQPRDKLGTLSLYFKIHME